MAKTRVSVRMAFLVDSEGATTPRVTMERYFSLFNTKDVSLNGTRISLDTDSLVVSEPKDALVEMAMPKETPCGFCDGTMKIHWSADAGSAYVCDKCGHYDSFQWNQRRRVLELEAEVEELRVVPEPELSRRMIGDLVDTVLSFRGGCVCCSRKTRHDLFILAARATRMRGIDTPIVHGGVMFERREEPKLSPSQRAAVEEGLADAAAGQLSDGPNLDVDEEMLSE